MKTIHPSATPAAVLCALVMALSAPSAAAQFTPFFYLKADAGGVVTEDTSLREFFGPVTPGSEVKFDPGARFGFAGGLQVTEWFAAEFEFGVIANSIDFITDASRVDATFSNVPLLVNVRLECPRRHRFAPYIGAGIGGSVSAIHAERINIDGTIMDGGDADAVFAYQAFGGVRYRLNEAMGLSVEYRFFAAEAPEWQADIVIGAPSDRMGFGRIYSHSLSIAFDWTF